MQSHSLKYGKLYITQFVTIAYKTDTVTICTFKAMWISIEVILL
jgi:hypothetical protein